MTDNTEFVQVHIYGLDEVNAKLDQMARDVMPEMKKATNRATKYVLSQIPAEVEIPKPIGSKYVRTNKLDQHYFDEVMTIGSNEIAGVVGNNIVYAPWVVGPDYPGEIIGGRMKYQAKIHRGRWYTLYGVVLRCQKKIVAYYERMVKRIVEK